MPDLDNFDHILKVTVSESGKDVTIYIIYYLNNEGIGIFVLSSIRYEVNKKYTVTSKLYALAASLLITR